jgi:hypothetical protein
MPSTPEFDDPNQPSSGSSSNWDDDERWNPASFQSSGASAYEPDEIADDETVGIEDPIHDPVEEDAWPTEEDAAPPPRRSILPWIAGGVVIALVALALIWGASGIGRSEPTPTPVATLPSVFSTPVTPTLPSPLVLTATVAVTATQAPVVPTGPIAAGVTVRVVNSAPEGVSLRAGGGTNYARLATLTDGMVLVVLEPPAGFNEAYPSPADGFTWWRVRTENGTIGWIADNWLEPSN